LEAAKSTGADLRKHETRQADGNVSSDYLKTRKGGREELDQSAAPTGISGFADYGIAKALP
jgi:hypothetical protein